MRVVFELDIKGNTVEGEKIVFTDDKYARRTGDNKMPQYVWQWRWRNGYIEEQTIYADTNQVVTDWNVCSERIQKAFKKSLYQYMLRE